MLKPSQQKFKFPIRLFDFAQMEYNEWLQETTNGAPEREIRDYAIGMKAVEIDSIDGWNEGFSVGRTIKDVKRYGLDHTKVEIEGQIFICDWDLKTFEKEYDKHFRKLKKYIDASIREEDEEEEEEKIKSKKLEKTIRDGK